MLTTKPQYLPIRSERVIGNLTEYTLEYPTRAFKQASCKNTDTEFFYPDKDVFDKDEIALFQKMCNGCAVKNKCLEWALAHERYGVWAGTTPAQRVRIRKRLKWAVAHTFFKYSTTQRYGS